LNKSPPAEERIGIEGAREDSCEFRDISGHDATHLCVFVDGLMFREGE
jgi:hypothetical protein